MSLNNFRESFNKGREIIITAAFLAGLTACGGGKSDTKEVVTPPPVQQPTEKALATVQVKGLMKNSNITITAENGNTLDATTNDNGEIIISDEKIYNSFISDNSIVEGSKLSVLVIGGNDSTSGELLNSNMEVSISKNDLEMGIINPIASLVRIILDDNGLTQSEKIQALEKVLNNFGISDLNNDGKIDRSDINYYDMPKDEVPIEVSMKASGYLDDLLKGNDMTDHELEEASKINIAIPTIETNGLDEIITLPLFENNSDRWVEYIDQNNFIEYDGASIILASGDFITTRVHLGYNSNGESVYSVEETHRNLNNAELNVSEISGLDEVTVETESQYTLNISDENGIQSVTAFVTLDNGEEIELMEITPDNNSYSIVFPFVSKNGSIIDFADGDVFTLDVDVISNTGIEGEDESKTVSKTITAINALPTANNDTASVIFGESVTINAVFNDSDADGDILTISKIVEVVGGTADIVNNEIVFTATDESLVGGYASIKYEINDGHEGTNEAEVKISIEKKNELPTAINSVEDFDEDQVNGKTFNISANFTDLDPEDIFTYELVSDYATIDSTTGEITMANVEPNFNGNIILNVIGTTDNNPNDPVTSIITVTINEINDAPTLNLNITLNGTEGTVFSDTLYRQQTDDSVIIDATSSIDSDGSISNVTITSDLKGVLYNGVLASYIRPGIGNFNRGNTETITITITDNDGATSSKVISIQWT